MEPCEAASRSMCASAGTASIRMGRAAQAARRWRYGCTAASGGSANPTRGRLRQAPARKLHQFRGGSTEACGVTSAIFALRAASAAPVDQASAPASISWNRRLLHTSSRWPMAL